MSATIRGGVTRRGPANTARNALFIISPIMDVVFIIGAPLVALVLAAILFTLPDPWFEISIRSDRADARRVLVLAFVNAHTFVMFFRSHANQNIFKTYPIRFTVVPLFLFLLGGASSVALLIMGLVIVWWDIYHAGMQTFGFGRIYDSKQKNDPTAGRSLDYWMNLLMIAGPVLSGANFITHLDNTGDILQFLTPNGSYWGDLLLQRIPGFLTKHQPDLARMILVIGACYSVYYVYSYRRLQQQGYRVSWQKVWLLIIAAAVSIYIWGFHSFFDAFWVQNFFHSLQYFAIVLFSEKRNLTQTFRLSRFAYGGALAMVWVTTFCLLAGVWAAFVASGSWSSSLLVTTAIMHYWYDGFIWSVKKKQV